MADLSQRLDEMEAAIRKPSFRQSSGRANEVNYWIFDYNTDPVIRILPQDFFMHCFIMIILIVIVLSLISYLIYRKQRKEIMQY